MNGSPASQATRTGRKPTPFLWALLILTVLVVSRVHSYFGLTRVMRPAVLLVLWAGGYAWLRPAVIEARNAFRSWPPKVVLGLAVMACLSVPFGISVGRAGLFVISNYWKTILYFMLLVVAMRSTRDMARIIWAVVVGVGILAFFSIFILGISKTQGAAGYDANDVGLVMIMGLPLTLLTLQASRKGGKTLSVIALLMVAGTIAKSQSRGAFVALLIVGVVLLTTIRGVSIAKRVGFVAVAAVTLAVAAPPGYWTLMQTLKSPQQDYNWDSTNGRREIAKRGLHYMMQYPIFGIGVNNFPMAEATISSKAAYHMPGTGLRWAAAHNSYVEAGAEMGIPGMVLWLVLIFRGIYSSWRLGRRMPESWKRGSEEQRWLFYTGAYLPISITGFAVASFFVSFTYLEPVYILAALVTGLDIFASRALKHARSGTVPRAHSGRVVRRRAPQPWLLPVQKTSGSHGGH